MIIDNSMRTIQMIDNTTGETIINKYKKFDNYIKL